MATTILHQISIWIVVLPFLVGIMNYRGLNTDSRWIFLLTCMGLLPQLMVAFIDRENAFFNTAYNLYTIVEFGILLPVFYPKYQSRRSRLLVQATTLLYLLVAAFLFVRYGIKNSFLSGLVSVNNLVYMFWILLLLKQEYTQDQTIITLNNPFTWYFSAFILYAPCTVAIFALYHYIREPASPWRIHLSAIHSVFNIFQYLLFTIGLSLRKQI